MGTGLFSWRSSSFCMKKLSSFFSSSWILSESTFWRSAFLISWPLSSQYDAITCFYLFLSFIASVASGSFWSCMLSPRLIWRYSFKDETFGMSDVTCTLFTFIIFKACLCACSKEHEFMFNFCALWPKNWLNGHIWCSLSNSMWSISMTSVMSGKSRISKEPSSGSWTSSSSSFSSSIGSALSF